jgi:tRNA(Arg) A34 adenosine deaminase TadA
MTEDERFMAIALEEARRALAEGNRPFGAAVARDGRLVARGRNLIASACDPTAHAELMAVRNACRALHALSLEGATLYTTCEPCLMCTSAILWAKIPRVVIGATWADAPASFEKGKLAFFDVLGRGKYKFEYKVGVMREECAKLYGG